MENILMLSNFFRNEIVIRRLLKHTELCHSLISNQVKQGK